MSLMSLHNTTMLILSFQFGVIQKIAFDLAKTGGDSSHVAVRCCGDQRNGFSVCCLGSLRQKLFSQLSQNI
jgi:hypothetical protein